MECDPILIVGAGPSGLSLAIFLQNYNVPFRIIDKNEGIVEESRALGIQPRTLEIFEHFGLSTQILEEGQKLDSIDVYLNSKPTLSISYRGLNSKYDFPVVLAQNETEELLVKYLKKKKIAVERSSELISFEDNGDHIIAAIKNKKGITEKARFSFVVGCDGAHSAVRHATGSSFKGFEYPEAFSLVDVKMDSILTQNKMHIFPSDKGAMAIFPFAEKDKFRVVVSHPPSKKKPDSPNSSTFTKSSLTAEEMAQFMQERGLNQFRFTKTLWLSDFHIHRRLAKQWVKNRSILVGDAAHIHSPIGGQGMNTGIQDAWNLSWKLAFILQHNAPLSWLSTYAKERHYTGKQVLGISNAMTKMATLYRPWQLKIRNFVIRNFGQRFIVPKASKKLSQLYFQYPRNVLCERDFFPLDGIPTGMNAFDYPLSTSDLFKHLDPKCFTLIIFARSSRRSIEAGLFLKKEIECAFIHCVIIALAPYAEGGVLFDPSGRCHKAYGASGEKLVLIRPDRYIAWQKEGIDARSIKSFFKDLNLT